MHVHRGEDKPLLVSIFEGKGCGSKGSDDETYVNTKYSRPAAMNRWKEMDYGGQNRAKSFMAGAASVIKRWPDHVTLCWCFAIAFCLIIITGVLMMGSIKLGSNRPFSALSLQQKCLLRHKSAIKNARNEFPENTDVYLHVTLNDDETFNMDKYDDIFSSIGQLHPNHIINIYVLHNDTSEVDYTRNIRFKDWEVYHNKFDQPNFFDTSSAEQENANLATVDAKNRNIGHTDYQNVKIIRSTFSNYFHHSPLRYRWRIIPPAMLPFVFRVLTLWEHGGITMPWQLFLDKTDIYCKNKDETDKFQDLVKDLKNNFAILEKTTVFTPLDKQLLIEDIQRFVDIRGSLSVDYDSPLSEEKLSKPTTSANIILQENIEKNKEENVLKIQQPEDYNDPSTVKYNYSDNKESSKSSSSSESKEKIDKQLNIDEKTERRMTDNMREKRPRADKTDDNVAVEVESSIQSPDNFDRIDDEKLNNDLNQDVKLSKKEKQRLEDKLKRNKKIRDSEERRDDYGDTNLSRETSVSQETTTKKKSNRIPEANRNPVYSKKEMQQIQDKLKLREKEKNNAKENDERRRAKRDLNNLVIEILPEESKSFHEVKPSYIPKSLYQSDSEDYIDESDSEYESYEVSDSYSGFNAPKVFKTNLGRNLNELRHELSGSSSYSGSESVENTLKGISESMSDYHRSRNYFREQTAYVKYPVFSNINVFSLPPKLNLVIDKHGYYFSAKKPCHAFLGHMISALQSDYELKDVDTFVNDGLGSFCRGRKYNDCPGISLL